MSNTASAGSVKAGGAYVEVYTVDGKFNQGMTAIQNKLKSFSASSAKAGAALAAAGAAIVGPMVMAAKQFADAGDEVHKMAQRTGIATEFLSQMAFAASQSGSSLAAFEKGVKGMQRALYDAERGSKEAEDALKGLGLSVESLKGKGTSEQFLTLADRIAAIQDPSLRAAIAMKVFGKSGAELLPLMLSGRGGIEAMMKTADEFGYTLSQGDANAAAALTDALDKLWKSLDGLKNRFGAVIAGELTEWADYIQQVVPDMAKWVSENKQLVLSVGKIGGILAVAGGAFASLAVAAAALSTSIGVLTAAGGALAVTFGTLTGIGLAIALAAVTREIWLQVTAQRELNAAQKESVKLREKLSEADAKRINKTVAQANEIQDPAKRGKFLDEAIAAEQTNKARYEKQVASGQARVDAIQNGFGEPARTEGQKQVLIDQLNAGELGDARKKLEDTNAAIKALEAAKLAQPAVTVNTNPLGVPQGPAKESTGLSAWVKGLDRSAKDAGGVELINKFSGLGVAAAALKDAAAKQAEAAAARREAMRNEAADIRESIKTPLEKLDEQLKRLESMKNSGLLTSEEYRKAAGMAQLEAAQASGMNQADNLNRRTNIAAGLMEEQKQLLALQAGRGAVQDETLKEQQNTTAAVAGVQEQIRDAIRYLASLGVKVVADDLNG